MIPNHYLTIIAFLILMTTTLLIILEGIGDFFLSFVRVIRGPMDRETRGSVDD
jgi:hypothetical protein